MCDEKGRSRTSARARARESARERGVNVDHASSRARSTLSRRLSPVGLRRSLVCPYPPSLICGRFLTTPWAANSDVRLSARRLARGSGSVRHSNKLAARWRRVGLSRCARGFFGKLFTYLHTHTHTRAPNAIAVIGVCSRLDVNVNISSFSNPIKTMASELITDDDVGYIELQ